MIPLFLDGGSFPPVCALHTILRNQCPLLTPQVNHLEAFYMETEAPMHLRRAYAQHAKWDADDVASKHLFALAAFGISLYVTVSK